MLRIYRAAIKGAIKMTELLTMRDDPQGINEMTYRTMTVRVDGPSSIDEEKRSVEIVLATENPALVYDFNRYEIVNEVLVMSGCQIPKRRQVPMLDVHSRYTAHAVLGSIRELKKINSELHGKAVFSGTESTEEIWQKVREGHLTDFSAGYKPIDSEYIPAEESKTYRGIKYDGPLLLTKKWKIREGSIVPIGADELATARAAHDNKTNQTKEVHSMDEKTRKMLIELFGLRENASDEEAYKLLESLKARKEPGNDSNQPPAEPKEADIEKIRLEATGEERNRIDEIFGLGKRYDCVDIITPFIRDGGTLADAKLAVSEELMKRAERGDDMHHMHPATHGADASEKFRDAATDSIIMRSAVHSDGTIKVEKPAPGADELRGYSLRELAREALRISGQKFSGYVLDMVGRALTTSDLPNILANVAHKSLFAGWDTAPETWSVWCGTDQAEDFKTHSLPRGSEASDLDEIPDHGEYQYGKMTDAKEEYQLATYGKLFAITRQTIINDDLGALTRIPASHGESASRKVGDVAYAVLTANAAMGDGVALFASGHSNLVADGSGAAPGLATIAAGVLAMGTQKDLQGLSRLNIRPEYLIAPKALEGGTEVFLTSFQYSDSDTIATDSSLAATRQNPYAGSYFTRVYDSRLDDNDAAAWFLAARKGKTVVVFFLGGVQRPYTEQRSGWTVDGTEFKVRVDVGAKAVDWTGLYMNDGN
jgi:hypothetical protein